MKFNVDFDVNGLLHRAATACQPDSLQPDKKHEVPVEELFRGGELKAAQGEAMSACLSDIMERRKF